MTKTEELIINRLFEIQDTEYRDFIIRLTPTVPPDSIIGVRTPAMRKFASEVLKYPDLDEFLNDLPHRYYEENNLHGFVIEKIKDYDECIRRIDEFLPYINNWATCDLMSPKIFRRNTAPLLEKIKEWINSDLTYTIRFGIEMLMSFYLDDLFNPQYLSLVSSVRSEEYYVNMMKAWFFATALAKQYDATIPYIENHELDKWSHNKTIQKSVESYRITAEQKAYLKTLKIK